MKFLSRIISFVFLAAFVLFIYSCCIGGVGTIYHGPLPESALGLVPYLDDSTYSFRHSDGRIVNFQCSRETHEAWAYCADCCYEERYEANTTRLVPDTSMFSIEIEISNVSSADLICEVFMDKYTFYVPTNETAASYFEILDSLKIDSVVYYDVFKLGPPQQPMSNIDPVEMDSLFYNYANGILKILMSDGSYYKIEP